MIETWKMLLAFSLVILCMAIVGHMDMEDEIKQEQHYCEMRRI